MELQYPMQHNRPILWHRLHLFGRRTDNQSNSMIAPPLAQHETRSSKWWRRMHIDTLRPSITTLAGKLQFSTGILHAGAGPSHRLCPGNRHGRSLFVWPISWSINNTREANWLARKWFTVAVTTPDDVYSSDGWPHTATVCCLQPIFCESNSGIDSERHGNYTPMPLERLYLVSVKKYR